MGDRQHLTRQDQLSENNLWGDVYKRLCVWVVKKHRLIPADAEEIVQEGIEQFLAAGGNIADTRPNLLRGVGSRCNGLINNRHRKKALKAICLTADGVDPDNDDGGQAEKRLINDNWEQKAMSLLLERIENDEVAFSVLSQMVDGLEKPAELAKALGLDVVVVNNARRRLNGHVAAIKAAIGNLS